MRDQLADIEHKLKKVRKRTKEDEKKYADAHESIVGVEERCRKMEEIIKFRQVEAKKGLKVKVTPKDIEELEEQYE